MKNPDGSAPKFEYKFKCTRKGCKKTFIAEADDVDVAYFGQNWGGDKRAREYYVQCPSCGTDHIIKESLPDAVREKADAKEEERKRKK